MNKIFETFKKWKNRKLLLFNLTIASVFILSFSYSNLAIKQISNISTLSSIAEVRKRPLGVPLQGDIIMRSLYFHERKKPESNPQMNTLEAIDTFFVNRLEWVYGLPKIEKANLLKLRKKIDYFSGAINSNVDNINLAAEDLDGNYVSTKILGPEFYVGDMSKPDYYQDVLYEINHLIKFLKAYQTIPIIQRDDYQGNYRMLSSSASTSNRPGSFSNETIDAFKKYSHSEVNIKDYISIYLQEKDLPPNTDLRTQIHRDATIKKFVEFTEDLTINFYKKLRSDAVSSFVFSMNGGLNWSPVEQIFDYGFAEIGEDQCSPTFFHEIDQESRSLNKFNVVTIPKTPYHQTASHYEEFVRECIATSYASGIPMMVPWDVYMPNLPDNTKVERYYGKKEDYQDIYKFIHYNRSLFDNYEDAYVTGYIDSADVYWGKAAGKPYGKLQPNVTLEKQYLKDSRYRTDPPIIVNQPYFYAYGRAIPGQEDKPVVVHLVNWNPPASPQQKKLEITLNPQRFFGNNSYQVELFIPDANQVDGTKKILLAKGNTTTLTLDLQKYPLKPWGILVVSKIDNNKNNNSDLSSPYLTSPANNLCDQNCKVALDNSNKNSTIYYRLNNDVNSQWKKYERRFPIEQSTLIESRSYDGEVWSQPTKISLRKYDNYLVDSFQNNESQKRYVSEADVISSQNAKFKFDSSVLSGHLKIGDRKYSRGLSLGQKGNSSVSSLSLRVPRNLNYISADIGVDPKSARRPSFKVIVAGDRQILYETPVFNLSEEVIQEYQRKKYMMRIKIPDPVDVVKITIIKKGLYSYDNVAVLGNLYFGKK